MSGDTILFLVVAVIFVLFILPRLTSMMGGNTGTTGYPQGGNTPNNNGTLGGNDRPTYDSTDVESRGSIGRDRDRNSGGNILSRPSGGSSSSSGTGIFRTPSSGNQGNLSSSSSSRSDSPNVESRGSIGRDRD